MQDVAPDGEAAMDVDEALDAKMGEEPTPMVDTLCVCPIFVDQLTSSSVFDCERLVVDSNSHNGFEEVDLCLWQSATQRLWNLIPRGHSKA